MVTLSEDEPEPVARGPLKGILSVCLLSYIGYLILGGWCLYIETEHEAELEEQKAQNDDSAGDISPILELRAALGLIIFAIFRMSWLLLFIFEKPSNADLVSTIWLSISTFLMMVAYFTIFLNLKVFIHIHFTFITLFLIVIAVDFFGNIMILCRNSPAY